MMRACSASVFTLALATAPGLAQDAPITLAEALTGAQAVAAMDQGFLFVARADAAYVCAVNLSPSYFANIAAGKSANAAAAQPSALCVPAGVFDLPGQN